jgi:hypothetical protein
VVPEARRPGVLRCWRGGVVHLHEIDAHE